MYVNRMQAYVDIECVPRYSLPVLKIFNACNVYCIVSALAVNIGMHPYSYEQGFREIQRKKMSQSFVEYSEYLDSSLYRCNSVGIVPDRQSDATAFYAVMRARCTRYYFKKIKT